MLRLSSRLTLSALAGVVDNRLMVLYIYPKKNGQIPGFVLDAVGIIALSFFFFLPYVAKAPKFFFGLIPKDSRTFPDITHTRAP